MYRKTSIEQPLPLHTASSSCLDRQGTDAVGETPQLRSSTNSSPFLGMECQNLPSSGDLSEQEETISLLSKLSLSHSASTLSSGPLPPRHSDRKLSMTSHSSQHSNTNSFLVPPPTSNSVQAAFTLGEQILYQESFRESLQQLIMGHFQ